MGNCTQEVWDAATEIVRKNRNNRFELRDVVKLMKSRGTTYDERTIRIHIASRHCLNSPKHHEDDPEYLFERIGRGRYRLLTK